MSAFVPQADFGTKRQFPSFVVVGHPPRRQLRLIVATAVSEYPFSKTPTRRNKHGWLLHFWILPFSTTTTPAVLENSRNFRQKSAFSASFFWILFYLFLETGDW